MTRSIEALTQKVSENKHLLEWQPTPAENAYKADLTGMTLRIVYEFDEDTHIESYALQLLGEDGRTLLDTFAQDEFSTRFDELKEIHATARRIALKVDDKLDELEKQLDNLLPF